MKRKFLISILIFSLFLTNAFAASDNIRPAIKNVTPINGSENVNINNRIITIIFNESIVASANYNKITVTKGNVNSVIKKSIVGNKLTLTSERNWSLASSYKINIPSGALKDKSGNEITTKKTYSFTTKTSLKDEKPFSFLGKSLSWLEKYFGKKGHYLPCDYIYMCNYYVDNLNYDFDIADNVANVNLRKSFTILGVSKGMTFNQVSRILGKCSITYHKDRDVKMLEYIIENYCIRLYSLISKDCIYSGSIMTLKEKERLHEIETSGEYE